MKSQRTWLALEACSQRRVGGGGRAAFVATGDGEPIASGQSGRDSRVTPSATPAASGSSWRVGAPLVVACAPSSAPDNEERGAEKGARRGGTSADRSRNSCRRDQGAKPAAPCPGHSRPEPHDGGGEAPVQRRATQ